MYVLLFTFTMKIDVPNDATFLLLLMAGCFILSGCSELYAVKAQRDRKETLQRSEREIRESDELLGKPTHRSLC